MSDVDNLIPFLQQLLQRMRFTPPQEDMDYLKKATFKEMRPYFDALASGRPEGEVYKMVMTYLKNPGSGHALSNTASPPRPSAPPAAPPAPAETPSKKTQIRKITDGVELHVTDNNSKYTVELVTKGTADTVTLVVDFADSDNLTLEVSKPADANGPKSLTVNVPRTENTQGKELCAVVATLTPTAAGKNHSLNYKVAIRGATAASKSNATAAAVATTHSAPPPPTEGDEPDDVTTIADGLSLIVRSVQAGYALICANVHSANKYFVSVNLSESTNLTFIAKDPAKLQAGAVVSLVIPANAGQWLIADCNVTDFSLGSCDIRYKVTARVEN